MDLYEHFVLKRRQRSLVWRLWSGGGAQMAAVQRAVECPLTTYHPSPGEPSPLRDARLKYVGEHVVDLVETRNLLLPGPEKGSSIHAGYVRSLGTRSCTL